MAPSETFLRLQELGRKSREAGSAVDAAALPSASVLEREFGLFDSTRAGCLPTVDATTGAVSCACAGCERWKRYITGTLGEGWPTFPQYEVITADYVTQLARYLRRRRLEILGADEPRPLRVLELGAGDGRLTRHLREHLDGHGIEVYATDDHSLGLAKGDAKGGHHGVVAADALDAVSQCGFSREPTAAVSSSSSSLPGACDVALVCWQPMGVDWTAAIRASASFQEYVLVGEVDDGICGDPLRDVGRSSPRLRGRRGRRRDVRGGPGCDVRIGWMVQGGRDGGAGGQADMQDGRAVAHGSSLEDDVVSADGRRRRGSPSRDELNLKRRVNRRVLAHSYTSTDSSQQASGGALQTTSVLSLHQRRREGVIRREDIFTDGHLTGGSGPASRRSCPCSPVLPGNPSSSTSASSTRKSRRSCPPPAALPCVSRSCRA